MAWTKRPVPVADSGVLDMIVLDMMMAHLLARKWWWMVQENQK
jgi:hypothetical protein